MPFAPGRSGRVGLRWARRSRLGRPGARPPSRLLLSFRRFASAPRLCRWPGWVHYRPLGWRGRPSPTRGTPVLDEPVAAGCHATGGGADPRSPAPSWQVTARPPQAPGPCGPVSSGNVTGTHRAAHARSGRIMHSGSWDGRDRERNHSRSRGTRPQRSRPRTGVPPRRGRPPAQPQGSVVPPTQPPRAGVGVDANRIDSTTAQDRCGRPGGPSRERRAHERVSCRAAPRRVTRNPRPERGRAGRRQEQHDRSELRPSARPRTLTVVSQRSSPHDRSESRRTALGGAPNARSQRS
jgi:hypothetical protein